MERKKLTAAASSQSSNINAVFIGNGRRDVKPLALAGDNPVRPVFQRASLEQENGAWLKPATAVRVTRRRCAARRRCDQMLVYFSAAPEGTVRFTRSTLTVCHWDAPKGERAVRVEGEHRGLLNEAVLVRQLSQHIIQKSFKID